MQRVNRTTKQRKIMLEKLRGVCTHPTADEIYAMTREELPRISLGTVYRNLDLLARQGEILCLESGGSQKRFDGNIAPHHHARCVRCGHIADVALMENLPQVTAGGIEGFTLTGMRVEFEGVCASCSEAAKAVNH